MRRRGGDLKNPSPSASTIRPEDPLISWTGGPPIDTIVAKADRPGETMRWLRRMHEAGSGVVGYVALFIALGSGAYAAVGSIPAGSGIFQGCVNKKTGVLRVVSSPTACHARSRGRSKATEVAIAWNQHGVPGAPGAKGDTGPQGNPGTNGTSVTSQPLSTGDANCPAGGGKFTSVTGTTYACNGVAGTSPFLATAAATAEFDGCAQPNNYCYLNASSNNLILSLDQHSPWSVGNSYSSTGPLVLSRTATVFVTAEATLQAFDTSDEVDCRLFDADHPTDSSFQVGTADNVARIPTGAQTVTVDGYATLGPGTYALQLSCFNYNGGSSVLATSAEMNAYATAG
jgi:hypothetical protein